MDWPLIGAVGGLAVTVAVVGIGTVAILRSPAQEVRKSASAPLLWSERRPDVAPRAPSASPGLQLWDMTAGSAPVVPERERPVINDELTASANTAAPQARPPRRPPPLEPVVAKPALTPPPKKVALAYAPVATQPAPPKLQINPQVQVEPPKIIDRRYDGVLTMAEIARLRSGLRMTPDQVPLWGPVEAELRQIGRLQMAQINIGRKPEVPQSEFQRLYYAARPLLAIMRPDQKERVRGLARTMGYASVASMI
ncbi:MAG: hypothetical protein ACJ8DQ_18400 [Xanthobacteraceae bacterium]